METSLPIIPSPGTGAEGAMSFSGPLAAGRGEGGRDREMGREGE